MRLEMRALGSALLVATLGLLAAGQTAAHASASPDAGVDQQVSKPASVPLLAYYYIWFNPSSWERAKTDYPLLGTYSSDDSMVMRRHIELAQSSGIDGFLVSWKDTPVLTPRLERLVQIAREMDFSLGIVYQGLDFAREPISIEKVKHDLELLADMYSVDPVFDIAGKPWVVWTGTKKFDRKQIAYATENIGGRLSVLASAGEVDDYERVADLVQGNAHYWSSVNPSKDWYPVRMAEMSAAVHDNNGYWVAPAAPGFDARLVGGQSVIPRDGSGTLMNELAVAVSSDPDAIGLISWNEFSENSHVEPSENYGHEALEALARFSGQDADEILQIDSSEPARGPSGLTGWAAIAATGLVVGAGVVLIRRQQPDGSRIDESGEV